MSRESSATPNAAGFAGAAAMTIGGFAQFRKTG
jgi:hypothetical protein